MSYDAPSSGATYAMVAEFGSAEALLDAAEKTSQEGYRRTEAYTPFPVHGLSDALRFHDVRVPWLILVGGLCGGFFGYTLQWYTATIDYPLNVGGKPFNSLPSFFPVTYECTILWSALTAFFSVWALNGLPRPYHSIFNTPGFDRASKDRFFLAIESNDPKFDSEGTREFMLGLNPVAVSEVEE
ncbi:MAG: DUF3341 domain-containing protein [Fimbriimonas sp.]|nr:DUF3341 domain-containing protein [Fimbriimonas sp.]